MPKIKVSLRDMTFATAAVNNPAKAALVAEVSHALMLWISSKVGPIAPGVLIGGLAMSFYTKPRYTEDVDLLFLHSTDIPSTVTGMKRHRTGAFQDNKTHVEIEVEVPQNINLPMTVANKVFDTAVNHDGLRVASPEAMLVLKLYGSDTPRRSHKDMADVVSLLEAFPNIDLAGWELRPGHDEKLASARRDLEM